MRLLSSLVGPVVLGLAGLALAPSTTAQERALVLRGAEVHPVAGPVIPSGVVVIAGGKILAVGDSDLTVPEGARVVDCKGLVVTPGLIDAATTLGVTENDENEQADEITPQVHVLDAVDPTDPAFERARRAGVTAVQINPGNRNVIGGLGAVLKTAGETVREMLVEDETCLKVALGSEPSAGNMPIRGGAPVSIYFRRPTTRMGVVWMVRKAFYDAKAYRERKTVPGAENPPPDPRMEVLVRALEGKLSVRTLARAEQDIRTALRLAREFGYSTVIEEATEAYKVADEVARAKARLVYGAPSVVGNRGDGAEARLHTLSLLASKGVRFAIATGYEVGALDLAREAMFAVRAGLPVERALEAVTRVPAEILGVDDRLGTLEPGKDADLVAWSGPLFDPTTFAKTVYINGEEVQ